MPKVYVRKNHKMIKDLYNVLLFCDVRLAITEKRQDELLEWLWRQMKPEHKRFGAGPHVSGSYRGDTVKPPPRSLTLLNRYNHFVANEKFPKKRAKALLMEEFGLSREALEQALYRARRKAKIKKIDESKAIIKKIDESDEIPF